MGWWVSINPNVDWILNPYELLDAPKEVGSKRTLSTLANVEKTQLAIEASPPASVMKLNILGFM